MRNIFGLMALFLSSIAIAKSEGLPSPDGKYIIFQNCQKEYNQDCIVYARSKNSEAKTWIIKDPFPSSASIEWHSAELASIYVSCGSPCNATFFFNPQKGVSIPYSLVLATEPTRLLVVVPEHDLESDTRSVKVFSIFSPENPVLVINRNFSEFIQFVDEVSFDHEGNLHLSYSIKDEPERVIKEVIPIKSINSSL